MVVAKNSFMKFKIQHHCCCAMWDIRQYHSPFLFWFYVVFKVVSNWFLTQNYLPIMETKISFKFDFKIQYLDYLNFLDPLNDELSIAISWFHYEYFKSFLKFSLLLDAPFLNYNYSSFYYSSCILKLDLYHFEIRLNSNPKN